MPGIATLNETARNMTRKPRGIGYYQQYAMGGEVSGPPPMRGPDPQGIPKYAMGGLVNLSGLQQAGQPVFHDPNQPVPMALPDPMALREMESNYPFQGMAGDAFAASNGLQGGLAPGLPQYGGYLEQKYGNPEFGQKKEQFLQDVKQKEQQTFGGIGGLQSPILGSLGEQFFAQGGEVEVSEEPLSEYQRALIASESSGRSDVVNESGYRGLTQGGDAAISDFKAQEGLDFTDEEYINSPDLQMQFQRWYEQKTIDYVMDKGLDAYIGRVIKGVPITMSSLLGMAHIGGDFGMQQFLETGGRYDPNDGKTSLSDYGRRFANMAIYGESGGENFNRVTPEDALMSMPVEQEGSLEFYRPRARPPEIEFSAPLTSLRPQARTDSEEMGSVNRPLALPEGQSMIEKYGLPGDMPQGGIMSANR